MIPTEESNKLINIPILKQWSIKPLVELSDQKKSRAKQDAINKAMFELIREFEAILRLCPDAHLVPLDTAEYLQIINSNSPFDNQGFIEARVAIPSDSPFANSIRI